VEWAALSKLHDNLSPYRLSAELLLFILQPHARLHKDLKAAQARIGWESLPRPILALHVRHGKKWQESEWFPTEDYLQVRSLIILGHLKLYLTHLRPLLLEHQYRKRCTDVPMHRCGCRCQH
jgi:hypothetical protein